MGTGRSTSSIRTTSGGAVAIADGSLHPPHPTTAALAGYGIR